MTFQSEPGVVRWRLHCRAAPEKVFEALATDAGRARYWAESTDEDDGVITFRFLNHPPVTGRILDSRPPHSFSVEYFGAVTEFLLSDADSGGTDLTLVASGVPEEERVEVIAGWASVLLALKAQVDHGVDLRNHDESRTWSSGYVDN